MTIPWTPGLELRCPGCGWLAAPSPDLGACGRCAGPLETWYPEEATWRLPLPARELADLGRCATPLVADPGRAGTLLKLETRNATGSHKDRFHPIVTALARLAGAPGVFTTSTGNHGVSCAAHAAREGRRCVVLSTSALPRALGRQIMAYGAVVGMLDPAARVEVIRTLVERGWLAATSSDPALSGAGSPYGADGYRLVVDELVEALGRLPDALAVPCASGDTLVGIVRGVHDQARRLGVPQPAVLACQPARAGTLRASLSAGRPAVLPDAASVARSTADERAGRLGIAAAAAATVVEVEEDAIIAATARLAAGGLYVETSSALAVAAIDAARADGRLRSDALAVAILTAQGRGWNEDEPALAPARGPLHDAGDVLAAALRSPGEAET